MFKKFGENPPAYAIVLGCIALVITNGKLILENGEDGFFLPISVGVAIGLLVFLIGLSQKKNTQYNQERMKNMKLREENKFLKTAETNLNYRKNLSHGFDKASFEDFRDSLPEFEKHVLNHFKYYTGHELMRDLYNAKPNTYPEHWLVKIFSEVIYEYQINYSNIPEAIKTEKAGDFLIYRVVKHHPKKQEFVKQAKNGINYLLDKYEGAEKKRIEVLLYSYNF